MKKIVVTSVIETDEDLNSTQSVNSMGLSGNIRYRNG